jgi:hypothetical protein
MTLKLELAPTVESGLLAQAQARGLSLEEYVKKVLTERSTINAAASEKAREFEAWARGHAALPPLPDEALRRENLIRDAR